MPGGCAASRRLLAPARRAPRLLRPRPSSAALDGAPRCPQKTASPTPHPGSARWGPRGLRRHGRPTRRADSFPPPEKMGSFFGRVGFPSAGAAGGRSLRSPRAPDARAVLGRRRRGLMRTPRGPGAERALRSRAEECAAAVAGETQGRTRPPRHRQKTTASRSEKERRAPAGQNSPHAVKEERKVRAATRPASTASSNARYSAQCR